MKQRDFLRIVAVEALEGPGEFSAGLREGAARLPVTPPLVTAAAARAEAGDLRTALWGLRRQGLSGTFSLAASTAPAAARELLRQLQALPSAGAAALRLTQTLLYAWLMVLVAGTLWGSGRLWVAPVFEKILGREVSLGALSGPIFLTILVPFFLGSGALLLMLFDQDLRERVLGRLAAEYDAARSLLAAGVLVGQGLRPAEALDHLDPAARRAGHAALERLGNETLEASVLLREGRSLAEAAAARLDRRFAAMQIGLVLGLGLLYGSIILDFYLAVSAISGSAIQ